MSSAIAVKPSDPVLSRRQRAIALASLPVIGFIALTLVIASGVPLTPNARAANPENVLVTGTVAEFITMSQSCAGGTDIGALTAAAAMTGANCTITASTNRPTGYYIGVQEDNVSTGANRPANTHPAFCRVAAGNGPCVDAGSADTDNSVANITGGTALNATADKFGVLGVTGGTATMNGTGSWTSGAAAVGTAQWQPVGETGSSNRSCDLTAPANNLTCLYRFGAYIGGTQAAGNYEAKIAFLGVAD